MICLRFSSNILFDRTLPFYSGVSHCVVLRVWDWILRGPCFKSQPAASLGSKVAVIELLIHQGPLGEAINPYNN